MIKGNLVTSCIRSKSGYSRLQKDVDKRDKSARCSVDESKNDSWRHRNCSAYKDKRNICSLQPKRSYLAIDVIMFIPRHARSLAHGYAAAIIYTMCFFSISLSMPAGGQESKQI